MGVAQIERNQKPRWDHGYWDEAECVRVFEHERERERQRERVRECKRERERKCLWFRADFTCPN